MTKSNKKIKRAISIAALLIACGLLALVALLLFSYLAPTVPALLLPLADLGLAFELALVISSALVSLTLFSLSIYSFIRKEAVAKESLSHEQTAATSTDVRVVTTSQPSSVSSAPANPVDATNTGISKAVDNLANLRKHLKARLDELSPKKQAKSSANQSNTRSAESYTRSNGAEGIPVDHAASFARNFSEQTKPNVSEAEKVISTAKASDPSLVTQMTGGHDQNNTDSSVDRLRKLRSELSNISSALTAALPPASDAKVAEVAVVVQTPTKPPAEPVEAPGSYLSKARTDSSLPSLSESENEDNKDKENVDEESNPGAQVSDSVHELVDDGEPLDPELLASFEETAMEERQKEKKAPKSSSWFGADGDASRQYRNGRPKTKLQAKPVTYGSWWNRNARTSASSDESALSSGRRPSRPGMA